MSKLDEKYPMYGFASHQGYGTADHMESLRAHGPCAEHRRSFGPVRVALGLDVADNAAAVGQKTLTNLITARAASSSTSELHTPSIQRCHSDDKESHSDQVLTATTPPRK